MQSSRFFPRTIGLPAATSIVIGSIIGSGIFMRPAEMASLLGSPTMIMLVWVFGGIVTLFAAMVSAEIGSMFPQTGGQYVFMRNMYGKFWSYLFGWANFSVINTAGTAGIAFIFAQYLEYFFTLPHFSKAIEQSWAWHLPFVGDIFPLQDFGVKIITIILLALLTLMSYLSTRVGSLFQLFFTVIKLVTIILLAGGLIFSGKGSMTHFSEHSSRIMPVGFAFVAAMMAAINGALLSYDGWANMLTVSGEIKNPGKNIPRSLFMGVGICMLIYLAISASMIYILPVDKMATSELVASDAAKAAFGSIGGGIIALLICISIIGTTNANVLTPPRMTFAMSQEGNFFAFTGRIHPKHNTPGNALLLHFVIMALMVFSGSFYILTDMYIFIAWLFNLMLIAGIFILRKKMPDTERPFKMKGYPWIPGILLLFNAFYLVMTLYNDISSYLLGKTKIMNSVFGIALVCAGIPFYFYFHWRYKQNRPLVNGPV